MIPEGLTEEEFLRLIRTMDPAHRVLARIEWAKQQVHIEAQLKEKQPCSTSISAAPK